MAHNPIVPFDFDGNLVRIVEREGAPWWIASDIASILGYREAYHMVRGLDEDQKGPHLVGTLGGMQEMTVINESGVYDCILRSKRPEAKVFRKWVTSEVLPSIRRNGVYSMGRDPGYGQPPVKEMIALQKERDRITIRFLRETGPLARELLYADLARTIDRLGGTVPTLEEIDRDLTKGAAGAIADFFAGLNTLDGMGVPWNLHRQPDNFLAFNPAIIARLFHENGLRFNVDADVINALKQSITPRFVTYRPYNAINGKSHRCLIFEKTPA